MPPWAWSTSPWTGNCRCGHACGIRVVFNIAIQDIGGLEQSSSGLADELADELAYELAYELADELVDKLVDEFAGGLVDELADERCRCGLNDAAMGMVNIAQHSYPYLDFAKQ